MNAKIKSGAMVGAVAIAGLGVVIKDLIMTSADFGRAISQASVKFPEDIERGTQAFKDLEESAKKVGRTTEFTATQGALGLNFLAKAGYSAGFSMSALPDIVDFATASELEFATASDIASDAMGAFNLNAKDETQRLKNLNRVMDVMSLASIRSNTSVEELFETMKKGAPVAEASGASIETYSAIMATLAGAGIKGSIAGTSAKRLFLSLAGIGSKASAVMKDLKIETADLKTGKLKDQFDVLDEIFTKLDKMNNQKARLGYIERLFGKIPLASANVLLRDSTANLRKLRKEFETGEGSTKRMARAIRSDLKGSIDSLLSAIEAVKLKGTDQGMLKGVIDSMVLWTRTNEDMLASGITDAMDSLVTATKFLWEHRTEIKNVAKAYVALSIALKAVALGMVSIDSAMKLKAWALVGGAPAFMVAMGAVWGAGIKKFSEGQRARSQAIEAFNNYGAGLSTGNAPVIAPTSPLNGASRGFNNSLKIDINGLPKGSRVEGDLDESIELNTGYSGKVD
jgi:TP901 family phage tail tape measure protein